MQWKTVGIIFVVIAFLVILGAVGWKIMQKTEGYRAQEQTFYSPTNTYLPFSFGCSNIKAEGFKKPTQPMNRTK